MDPSRKLGTVNACANGRGVTRRIELVDFAPLGEGRGDTCPVCRRLYGLGQFRASVDHIVLLSQGDEHAVTNIRIICKGCNEDAWHSLKHLPSIQSENVVLLNKSEIGRG